MCSVRINFSEKPLLHHLSHGGKNDDETGKALVAKVISTALSDQAIITIVSEFKLTEADLVHLYCSMIDGLPDPRIYAGGPMLVPTLFLMEPHRLRKLATDIDRNIAALGESKRQFAIMQVAMDAAEDVWLEHTSASGQRALLVRAWFMAGVAALFVILAIIGFYTWS